MLRNFLTVALLIISVQSPINYANPLPTDVPTITVEIARDAVVLVSSRVRMPTTVVVRDFPDAIGTVWRGIMNRCEVQISNTNVGFLDQLTGNQPKVPMMEGFAAHELAHCFDVQYQLSGLTAITIKDPEHGTTMRVRAEALADIMAIMYWKQEYPADADYFTRTLLWWREGVGDTDHEHDTSALLKKAIPLIPNHVNYFEAGRILSIAVSQLNDKT